MACQVSSWTAKSEIGGHTCQRWHGKNVTAVTIFSQMSNITHPKVEAKVNVSIFSKNILKSIYEKIKFKLKLIF